LSFRLLWVQHIQQNLNPFYLTSTHVGGYNQPFPNPLSHSSAFSSSFLVSKNQKEIYNSHN
jgi:hypothetical protein